MISMTIATMRDAAEMAPHMRAADVREVRASGGDTPLKALEDSITLSRGAAWTIRCDGDIMGVWGVLTNGLLASHGVIWMLTTGQVERRPKEFYRASLKIIAMLRKHYASLMNYVDARHTAALRWAKRVGFNVAEAPVKFGVEGLPFYKIELMGESHV